MPGVRENFSNNIGEILKLYQLSGQQRKQLETAQNQLAELYLSNPTSENCDQLKELKTTEAIAAEYQSVFLGKTPSEQKPNFTEGQQEQKKEYKDLTLTTELSRRLGWTTKEQEYHLLTVQAAERLAQLSEGTRALPKDNQTLVADKRPYIGPASSLEPANLLQAQAMEHLATMVEYAASKNAQFAAGEDYKHLHAVLMSASWEFYQAEAKSMDWQTMYLAKQDAYAAGNGLFEKYGKGPKDNFYNIEKDLVCLAQQVPAVLGLDEEEARQLNVVINIRAGNLETARKRQMAEIGKGISMDAIPSLAPSGEQQQPKPGVVKARF